MTSSLFDSSVYSAPGSLAKAVLRAVPAQARQSRPKRSSPWLKRYIDPNRLSCLADSRCATRAVKTLLAMSQVLASQGTRDNPREELLEVMLKAIGAETAYIYRLQGDRNQLRRVSVHRCGDAASQERIDPSLVDYVLDTGLSLGMRQGEVPVAHLPLRDPGSPRVRGALVLARSPGANSFQLDELELGVLFASQLCLWLFSPSAPAHSVPAPSIQPPLSPVAQPPISTESSVSQKVDRGGRRNTTVVSWRFVWGDQEPVEAAPSARKTTCGRRRGAPGRPERPAGRLRPLVLRDLFGGKEPPLPSYLLEESR